jgi:hypothetical protein
MYSGLLELPKREANTKKTYTIMKIIQQAPNALRNKKELSGSQIK